MADPKDNRASGTLKFRKTRSARTGGAGGRCAKEQRAVGGLTAAGGPAQMQSAQGGAEALDQEMPTASEILSEFDANYRYGPSVGISRLARWERALRLGLSPPPLLGEIMRDDPTEGGLPVSGRRADRGPRLSIGHPAPIWVPLE